ncbi:hypothetical protein T10_7124 [Trichinella papuae]|uniref:Uncharacterized protein n=1 Tax=Trichinella papuae TaxID=268474 RepID=A0A0V1N5S2_9BILA|nr:hypothetical protein T10_7124 [Trichinella papuae]
MNAEDFAILFAFIAVILNRTQNKNLTKYPCAIQCYSDDVDCDISEIVDTSTPKFLAIFLNDLPLSTRLRTSSFCSEIKTFPFQVTKIRKQQNSD